MSKNTKHNIFSFIKIQRYYISILSFCLCSVAICLDASLYHARSKPSESFNSPQLAGNEGGDFLVDIMEVWTLH
jgi:hypothetical protein